MLIEFFSFGNLFSFYLHNEGDNYLIQNNNVDLAKISIENY